MIQTNRGIETQALSDMILPKGESILSIPTSCQAEANNLWIPYRLQMHGPTLHHKETAWKDSNIDLKAWKDITASSKNLTSMLSQGKAELTQVLKNITANLGDFTDYTATIRDVNVRPQLHDGSATASPYDTHPIFSYSVTGIIICLGTLLIINLARRIWQSQWLTCINPPTDHEHRRPSTDKSDRIVVNFTPKDDQVRFLPQETRKSTATIARSNRAPRTKRREETITLEDE
jgi:hypothetical protein